MKSKAFIYVTMLFAMWFGICEYASAATPILFTVESKHSVPAEVKHIVDSQPTEKMMVHCDGKSYIILPFTLTNLGHDIEIRQVTQTGTKVTIFGEKTHNGHNFGEAMKEVIKIISIEDRNGVFTLDRALIE